MYLDISGCIWSYLDVSGPTGVCSTLDTVSCAYAVTECIWMYLVISGHIWAYLDISGDVWSASMQYKQLLRPGGKDCIQTSSTSQPCMGKD